MFWKINDLDSLNLSLGFLKMFLHYNKMSDLDTSLHSGIPKRYRGFRLTSEWEIPPWELSIDRHSSLGRGTFADVYMGTWRHTPVVVKVFNTYSLQEKENLIRREIDIMTKLHHPNIVQVLGFMREPFVIVMEYMPGGDLLQNIKHLNTKEKLHIMRDCLRALCYLHNRRPQSLIHRDIKLSNILLSKSKHAKIADFGLSKLTQSLINNNSNNNLQVLVDNETELTQSVGTERYQAPEMPCATYTNKIDIYALGICIYELFESTRYQPSKGFMWNATPHYIRSFALTNMLCQIPDERKTAVECLTEFERLPTKQSMLTRFLKSL